MPLDFTSSEANNFGYPPELIRCTESWEEAVRAYRECGQFIFRPKHIDPAVAAYTDRICTDERYFDLLNALHKFEMKVAIDGDGEIVGRFNINKAPEYFQVKAPDLLNSNIKIRLCDIFEDEDATAYIAQTEKGVRAAQSVLGDGLFLGFRTKENNEDQSVLFHKDDRGEAVNINNGPSQTIFGAFTSFTRSSVGMVKLYQLNEGANTFTLERGDIAVLNLPHRPGVSMLSSGYKLWAGAFKLRK